MAVLSQATSGTESSLSGCYQEVLTTIARLLSQVDSVTDADRFRTDILALLRAAETDAARLRIDSKDIWLASYAVVAFIDTSIMTSRLPVFEDWAKQTLQAERYEGRAVGGEAFYDHLRGIMERPETASTADLLDLYLTCMLLGFRGRFQSETEQLNLSRPAIVQKIVRIRGESADFSPQWQASRKRIPVAADNSRTRRALTVFAAAASAVILYLGFSFLLDRGAYRFAEAAIGMLPR